MPFSDLASNAIRRKVSGFSGNSSGNAPTLLMLGAFKFSLNTAVFQELRRTTGWRWPGQKRVGQDDALQFTGPNADRITLPGIVYPDFRGGAGQLDTLRQIGDDGKPVRLISGAGQVMGLWVVESVDETATNYKVDGTPRRQEFSVVLRRYQRADV